MSHKAALARLEALEAAQAAAEADEPAEPYHEWAQRVQGRFAAVGLYWSGNLIGCSTCGWGYPPLVRGNERTVDEEKYRCSLCGVRIFGKIGPRLWSYLAAPDRDLSYPPPPPPIPSDPWERHTRIADALGARFGSAAALAWLDCDDEGNSNAEEHP